MRHTILSVTTILVLLFAAGCSQKATPEFAKCLSEKGLAMYGTDWCTHCQSQKKMFGAAFEYVNYTDCDYHKEECAALGIDGYPTWIVDGKPLAGEKTLGELSLISDCPLEPDNTP